MGPFLRINKLEKENVINQLFYLSKESLKHIVLYSGCGIQTSVKELKIKNISNLDINIFSSVSPLLCIYKKADPKLNSGGNIRSWNSDKFKREINITGNAFMTLSLLQLCKYYQGFKSTEPRKYFLGEVYKTLSKNQLEFYACHFRSREGVFVDKIDVTEGLSDKLTFNDKGKKFKYSSQALLMAAFYMCGSLLDNNEVENYKSFSMEILKMLLEYREELYSCSFNELTLICLGLNVFYSCSKNEECRVLLLDLCELLVEKAVSCFDFCYAYINSLLFYRSSGLNHFKVVCEDIYSKLTELYRRETGVFIPDIESKEIDFTCVDTISYLLCMLSGEDPSIGTEVFKRHVLDSGIILSWPEAPDIGDIERYRDFSAKSEDLLDDQNFRMPSVPSPESSELAPVFTKYVTYNLKKDTFTVSSPSFDSTKNMMIFFLILNLYP
ncbi:MAG: hypothetical protein ACM3X7_13125 [Solirubrobacterales bacterium]